MNRRTFSKITGMGVLALQSVPLAASSRLLNHEKMGSPNVPLGVANHSLRAMRPTAGELIEFAVSQKLDSVQFNTLAVFESFDDQYLAGLKELAHANEISIYVGVGSICESSLSFSDRFGNARELLKTGIRTAGALDSPIVGVRIGNFEDRYTDGGIQPKVDEVIKLMKSLEGPVLDAGIKFAFENHAGDLRSEELLVLINETGTTICGAFYDPGNAIYAMEDPRLVMQALGEHILCSQARDVVIWPYVDGAVFQWTAVGEGMMDFKFFTDFLSENCPGVPIQIETISNSPRSIPYLKDEYWAGFPDLRASGMIDFLKLVGKGQAIEVATAPAGTDTRLFDIKNQQGELLRSIDYLRKECGAGIKGRDFVNE